MIRSARSALVLCVGIAGAFASPACVTALRAAHAPEQEGARKLARQILKSTGVSGGLVVHLGCGDGRLTAALRADDRYLVQGLDADAAHVQKAREYFRSLGIAGAVSADRMSDGQLPYAENLVNLVVADDLGRVAMEEVMRVLAPGGVACVGQGDGWKQSVKPYPEAMDEWTHYLHDASGNAVARDEIVGPPKRMQWLDGPLWSRHHDTVPSINALVSAGGRIFYMVDEAPACIGGELPDQWSLAARDAFNGVLLWKRPVASWGWRAWSGKWLGRFNQPNNVPKRLVAVGDRVYVTLGFNAPLTALDAATGRIEKTYQGTEFTDEILYHRGTLILSVNQAAQEPGTAAENPPVRKSVAAVDPETGRMRWKTGSYVGTSSKTGSVERVSHLLLAARGDCVFLVDREAIVALDLETGQQVWRAPRPEHRRYTSRYDHLMSDMCTLVAGDDAVLFAQLEPVQERIGWGVIKTGLYAFSIEDGKMQWSRVVGNWGHFCVPDVFVVRGLVWIHDYKSIAMVGLDPATGEEKDRISTRKWFQQGHHHRCYRNKATQRYIFTGYRGVELLDLDTRTCTPHHWSRGGCRYGILPCNGLLYSTPHPCACYIKAKLNGLYALAPGGHKGRGAGSEQRDEATAADRAVEAADTLCPGPEPRVPVHAATDWPTYRHDAARSGATPADVPTDLKPLWSAKIATRLSPPVVADGRLFVSAVDAHTVHALDARDGTPLWSRTLGGRVDSPPTFYGGLVLCGCADGRVYALDAADGEPAWRFHAAPARRSVVAFGRLESAWPVHGSVLVHDGVAYFTAGRSSYLDGGIWTYSADPMTGRILSRKRISSRDPETGRQPPQKGPHYMPGALSDILVGSEAGVTMRHLRIDDGDGPAGFADHLLCTAGFLDDSWFNRTGWSLGRAAGQLLAFDDQTICGVRAYSGTNRSGFFFPGNGYELFAIDRRTVHVGNKPRTRERNQRWKVRIPVRVRGMVLAGPRLVVAGPPDIVDREEPWAAFEGKKGGVMWTISAADGKKLGECALPAPPVFDGLIAAGGRLYLSLVGGNVLCMDARR